ncbi:MAG: phage virion morphogenesis protein [Proteobacteria bacterium]|nr:phage virion morphogenesis protein [Pseudomonadota bacterium]
MSLTLTLDKAEFDRTITRLLAGVTDFSPVTGAIAQLLENSVRRNFIEGGRPQKWPASKRADRDAGYGRKSGQTLIDTARLLNSITGVGDHHEVRVGTNVDYAAAHNFGVDKEITQQVREHVRRITQAFGKQIEPTAVTVKSHSRKFHLQLPAREFMLVQEEDWEDIAEIVSKRLNQLIKGD